MPIIPFKIVCKKSEALFGPIPDPRVQGRCKYPLRVILLIVLLATLAGCKGWKAIAQFAEKRKAILAIPMPCLKNGTPNCDTIARALAKVDVSELNLAFSKISIVIFKHLFRSPRGRPPKKKDFLPVLALDGKTARGSVDRGMRKSLVHIVNAVYSVIVLVVRRVKEKSNEITAYPLVIDSLHQMRLLAHCVITIDAMGCQKAIAAQLASLGGNWLFSLKGNQDAIHKSVMDLFEDIKAVKAFKDCFTLKVFRSGVKCHGGRHERYVVSVVYLNIENAVKYMPELGLWAGIKTLVKVERHVDARVVKGEPVEAVDDDPRYYISSLDIEPEAMHKTIIGHWSVEVVHNQLDVTFLEDKCRISRGACAEVLSTMRKLALNILNSIRWLWPKESLPTLIELFRDNIAFQEAVLERPPDKVGDPARWRKVMGEVEWWAGCPDPATYWKAA
jgi:predicted transposase YbfD/YdcC